MKSLTVDDFSCLCLIFRIFGERTVIQGTCLKLIFFYYRIFFLFPQELEIFYCLKNLTEWLEQTGTGYCESSNNGSHYTLMGCLVPVIHWMSSPFFYNNFGRQPLASDLSVQWHFTRSLLPIKMLLVTFQFLAMCCREIICQLLQLIKMIWCDSICHSKSINRFMVICYVNLTNSHFGANLWQASTCCR